MGIPTAISGKTMGGDGLQPEAKTDGLLGTGINEQNL